MPQQTPLQNYQTAYQKISEKIAALTLALASSTDDKQAYSIEGQSVSKKDIYGKLSDLYTQAEMMKRLIAMESGPYEVVSYGVPG